MSKLCYAVHGVDTLLEKPVWLSGVAASSDLCTCRLNQLLTLRF